MNRTPDSPGSAQASGSKVKKSSGCDTVNCFNVFIPDYGFRRERVKLHEAFDMPSINFGKASNVYCFAACVLLTAAFTSSNSVKSQGNQRATPAGTAESYTKMENPSDETGLGQSKYLPTGLWGGGGIRLTVEKKNVKIEYGCAE